MMHGAYNVKRYSSLLTPITVTLCMYVCMYVCRYVCTYVRRTYVGMWVCMYYVCMRACYIYLFTSVYPI